MSVTTLITTETVEHILALGRKQAEDYPDDGATAPALVAEFPGADEWWETLVKVLVREHNHGRGMCDCIGQRSVDWECLSIDSDIDEALWAVLNGHTHHCPRCMAKARRLAVFDVPSLTSCLEHPRGMSVQNAWAEEGTCFLCGQVMIRTASDCWHPWNVERACPPEPASTDRGAYGDWLEAGNVTNRPGRQYFVPKVTA